MSDQPLWTLEIGLDYTVARYFFRDEGAVKYVQAEEALVNNLAGMLKVAPNQLYDRIETLLAERKKMENRAGKKWKALIGAAAKSLIQWCQGRHPIGPTCG